MEDIDIRPAVSPDIATLAKFDHSTRTTHVWQMYQNVSEGEIETGFKETGLPREMKIQYPYSPESLSQRWRNYSTIMVACIDKIPIGYISISTYFTTEVIWVKDLVTQTNWRRKGVASKMLRTAIDWAKERNFFRISIEMSSKNYPAICFVKKMGFDFSGFNDNYYKNNDLALFFARYIR